MISFVVEEKLMFRMMNSIVEDSVKTLTAAIGAVDEAVHGLYMILASTPKIT